MRRGTYPWKEKSAPRGRDARVGAGKHADEKPGEREGGGGERDQRDKNGVSWGRPIGPSGERDPVKRTGGGKKKTFGVVDSNRGAAPDKKGGSYKRSGISL